MSLDRESNRRDQSMAKQQTEEELNLKRKARRRLVGAIALTLAVVVILPMVLDSEPKLTGQDIELRIPAPDKAGEFIPGIAPPEMAEVSPLTPPDVADVPAVEVVSASANVASGTDTPIKAQPADGNQPEVKAVDRPTGSGDFVVQIGAYTSADTAKIKFEQLKEWRFNKAYTEKVGDNIRVRVGPYSERKEAEQVRQLLEKHGLKPIVMSGQ